MSEPIRDLHYFFYPKWRDSTIYHLRQLRASIDQFNGKKVCCVAIDQSTMHEEIVDSLRNIFDVVYYRKNNRSKRELVGFIETLERLRAADPDRMICFAHAKGQQTHTHGNPVVSLWCDVLYETVVRNWQRAHQVMQGDCCLAGAFKSIGEFKSTQYGWHYSGSFFWARSAAIFSHPDWRETCSHAFGSESYVGRHWAPEQGHCLFADCIPGGSAYDSTYWESRLMPELIEREASRRLEEGSLPKS